MNGKTGSMNEELSKYPSEFVLENRQVQRVCSHPQEPEWVTNIKKGVISSFQSTILPEGSSLGFNVTEVSFSGIPYVRNYFQNTLLFFSNYKNRVFKKI